MLASGFDKEWAKGRKIEENYMKVGECQITEEKRKWNAHMCKLTTGVGKGVGSGVGSGVGCCE